MVDHVLRIAAFVPELLNAPADTTPDSIGQLTGTLVHLRYSCSYGAPVRLALAKTESLAAAHLNTILLNPDYNARPAQLCWQMLINISYDTAGDTTCGRLLWAANRATILEACANLTYAHAELCRMFVYKMLLDGHAADGKQSTKKLLKVFVQQLQQSQSQTIPEHLQFILEFYACRSPDVLPAYAQLDATERVAFVQFVGDLLRETANEGRRLEASISPELVQHMCREFKLKSDCVLKTEASYADRVHPREVYALLEVISTLSADVEYAAALATDHSLFLNVGCLLSSIAALGASQTANMFTPIAKLAQIAPNSTERTAIQLDVSYDLKSLLVRTIGNLAFGNARNQELAREMDILRAVLNCTSVDARNPLIKEWSVLAIRNLCDGCVENQALVRSLTKVGEADNSEVLREFNLEMGSMRIGGSK